MSKRKRPKKTPADQAKRPARPPARPARPAVPGSGKGGVVPPADTRWPPGQSGNPKGRPAKAGATIEEWVNQMGAQGLDEAEIRRIARDRRTPWPKRYAAERILRGMEVPDPADFQPLLSGKTDVAGLREMGVDTSLIKKTKFKTRTLRNEDGDEVGQELECELELHDRSAAEFDRIMDRTIGRPHQSLDVNADADPTLRSTADGVAAADALLARIRARHGIKP